MPNKRDDSIGRWWDRSWTMVRGCTWPPGEMPPACERCWARSMARRFRPDELEGVKPLPGNLRMPLDEKHPTVFACQINYGDLFHPDVPDGIALDAFDLCWQAPRHRYVFLTKRPHRASFLLKAWIASRHGGMVPDQWATQGLMVPSAWDQASVNDACVAMATLPAGMRWGLHLEPLLGPVELLTPTQWSDLDNEPRESLHLPSWVCVGGETGPGARPLHPDWVRSLRDQCAAAGVPFYLKSLGRKGDRTLDGAQHNAVPWEENGR